MKPENIDKLNNLARQNGCSVGRMIDWYVDNVLSDDAVLDAVIEASKMKTYRL